LHNLSDFVAKAVDYQLQFEINLVLSYAGPGVRVVSCHLRTKDKASAAGHHPTPSKNPPSSPQDEAIERSRKSIHGSHCGGDDAAQSHRGGRRKGDSAAIAPVQLPHHHRARVGGSGARGSGAKHGTVVVELAGADDHRKQLENRIPAAQSRCRDGGDGRDGRVRRRRCGDERSALFAMRQPEGTLHSAASEGDRGDTALHAVLATEGEMPAPQQR
jgi:hypothetical protein